MRTLLAGLLVSLPAWGAREFVAASSQCGAINTAAATSVPMTMAAWGYVVAGGATVPISIGTGGGTGRFQITLNGSAVAPNFTSAASHAQDSGVASTGFAASAYTTNSWNHFAAVFASITSRTMFQNGIAGTENTTSIAAPSALDRTLVGARISAGSVGAYYNGALANVAVWNVSLTAAEIASLAEGASPLTVRPQSLVFYAPMAGESSPEPNLVGTALSLSNSPAKATSHPRTYSP